MSIIDDAKSIVGIIRKTDNVELQQKILDLQGQILQLVEDNMNLKEEVRGLNERTRIKETLTFRNDAYWIPRAENAEDGPYCSKCWDSEGKLIRQHSMRNPSFHECPECKSRVKTRR
jgi:hypothetical protein